MNVQNEYLWSFDFGIIDEDTSIYNGSGASSLFMYGVKRDFIENRSCSIVLML